MPLPDDTYGWAYAPPSHLEGEPAVPIPEAPPGAEIAPNRPVHLPSGVVAYRQTYAEHDRLAELDRQREQARRAAEQAAMDAKMFAQMSRVATSMKDIEIARRSIDMMAGQRELDAGMPIHQVAARHPLMFGSGLSAALKTAPEAPFTPRSVKVGDAEMVETARNRFAQVRPPAAKLATPVPITLPDGTQVMQMGPNRFEFLKKPEAPPKPGALSNVETSRIRALDSEASSVRKEMQQLKPTSQAYVDSQMKLGEIQIKRNKILYDAEHRGKTVTPQKATAKPVAVIGQGTRTDPAKPENQEQMASIPSGAYYINPSDGKLYQKK